MPIAVINVIHSGTNAAFAKPDDAGRLYPTVLLSEGAHVMLTANVWQQVGLCNGAAGVVFKFRRTITPKPTSRSFSGFSPIQWPPISTGTPKMYSNCAHYI